MVSSWSGTNCFISVDIDTNKNRINSSKVKKSLSYKLEALNSFYAANSSSGYIILAESLHFSETQFLL